MLERLPAAAKGMGHEAVALHRLIVLVTVVDAVIVRTEAWILHSALCSTWSQPNVT